jgi:acyl-coenzyme A thioesterase PaaI-like protein
MPLLTAHELIELMKTAFPQARPDRFRIESVEDSGVRFRYRAAEDDLRPGDTVSGPTLMALCDLGMYFTVLAAIGPRVLAVTTSLNINFLRKPGIGELVIETKMLKLGKRLAVGEVFVFNDGQSDPVSHATVTYSIPNAGA